MTNDLSKMNPLADSLEIAIEQQDRATRLLLQQVAQQARGDSAFKQRLVREPEKAVREVAEKLPEAERKALGDKQVGNVTEVVEAVSSSILPEIDAKKVEGIVLGTIEDARRSFTLSLRLTQILFYAGLVMVGIAFLVAVFSQTDQVPSLIFGAVGVSGVFTSLLLNPLDRVQNAAANLIQLEISFLSYYKLLYLFHYPANELSVKDSIKIGQEMQQISLNIVAAIQNYCEHWPDGSAKASVDSNPQEPPEE